MDRAETEDPIRAFLQVLQASLERKTSERRRRADPRGRDLLETEIAALREVEERYRRHFGL